MTRLLLIPLINILLLRSSLNAQSLGSTARLFLRGTPQAAEEILQNQARTRLRLGAAGIQETPGVQQAGGTPRLQQPPSATLLGRQGLWGPPAREENSPWQRPLLRETQRRAYHTESRREPRTEREEQLHATAERLREVFLQMWGHEATPALSSLIDRFLRYQPALPVTPQEHTNTAPREEDPLSRFYTWIQYLAEPSDTDTPDAVDIFLENEPWLQDQFKRFFDLLFTPIDCTLEQQMGEEQPIQTEATELAILRYFEKIREQLETSGPPIKVENLAPMVAILINLQERGKYYAPWVPTRANESEYPYDIQEIKRLVTFLNNIQKIERLIICLNLCTIPEERYDIDSFIQKFLALRADFIILEAFRTNEDIINRDIPKLEAALKKFGEERANREQAGTRTTINRSYDLINDLNIDDIFRVVDRHIAAQQHFAAILHPELQNDPQTTIRQFEIAIEAVLSYLRADENAS